MNPKISVIMSIYKAARYLPAAIESILAQTYSNFEFIIVNDASPDDSRNIAQRYAERDQRIKIIDNDKNIGLTKSLNKGIGIARGEYIARLDADDISLPNRLEEERAFLDSNRDVALVGSWADIIDANDVVTRAVEYPVADNKIKKALIKYNPFFHPSIMIRRSVLESLGGYDERWRYAQDYELFLRISKSYKLANIPKKLILYREIPSSITAARNKAQISFVLKAKWKAISSGQYPLYEVVYLIPTLITWLLPVSLKRYIKNIVKK